MTEKVYFYSYVHIYNKNSFLVSSKFLIKILHRDSYSFLSVIKSCKNCLYNLSKDFIVC